MAVRLFLDANVFLSFYLFGKDDLTEMEKVVALVEHEELKLFVNDQLRSEIARNREAKIAEGYTPLKKLNFGQEFPNYCSDYQELELIKSALKEANFKKSQMIDKINENIKERTLRADILIRDLLACGQEIEIDENTILEAQRRTLLGNPPGKNGSIGDAIHWLTLLDGTNNGDLHLVTLDSDFSSKLNSNVIAEFLSDEWKGHKQFGKVVLHRSLSAFFKSKFPAVNLSTEQKKDELVERLKGSSSFAETHAAIAELSQHGQFTVKQKKGLFIALLHNPQVSWIATDPDVHEFFKSFEDTAWELDYDVLIEAEKVLEVGENFFLPF